MHKEPALVALQAIDVIVYKSSHQELSQDDVMELQSACISLIQSAQDNAYVAKKAAGIFELIHAAFLCSTPRPDIHREEILKSGISLSLCIQGQPEGIPGSGTQA